MGLTRQEINFRRLLAKCELLAKSNKTDERFSKYLGTLEDMLKEIMTLKVKPQEHVLNDYKLKVYNIKVALGVDTSGDKQFYLNESEDNVSREELLGLRQRNVAGAEKGMDDLEQVINFHQNIQEKIAEDMLQMTQNLKEQSMLANKIIKKDTEVVTKSAQLSDKNFTQLKEESDKLTEHSKRACKCWMWLMLLTVLTIFIIMVLFMKVVKKANK